jgi:hypothetical protein
MNPADPQALAAQVRAAMPAAGLFAGMDWLVSPEPFPLAASEVAALDQLGHRLVRFLRAGDALYRRSLRGRVPVWLADLLDRGKPQWMLDATRPRAGDGTIPRVIRPDLVLAADGFALTEIDSVPGGIGLLDWLNATYAALGWDVLGGATGMRDGFASIFAGPCDLAVSDEAATYRPEMAWLAARMRDAGHDCELVAAEAYSPRGRELYRFFEHFDWANLTGFPAWVDAWAAGRLEVTAPFKPWLEEKMWLALFWSAPLRELWDLELRRNHRQALERLIPFGWVVDPEPLPPHGVLPRLEVEAWARVAEFSQKQRELVLKVSGFHPLGWGARSVVVGHDVPHAEWRAALERAQTDFARHPWVMQEFRHARVVRHPVADPLTGKVRMMDAKARLTPYYFLGRDDQVRLGGVHATLCPADKKILHGMKDAAMVPCRLG